MRARRTSQRVSHPVQRTSRPHRLPTDRRRKTENASEQVALLVGDLRGSGVPPKAQGGLARCHRGESTGRGASTLGARREPVLRGNERPESVICSTSDVPEPWSTDPPTGRGFSGSLGGCWRLALPRTTEVPKSGGPQPSLRRPHWRGHLQHGAARGDHGRSGLAGPRRPRRPAFPERAASLILGAEAATLRWGQRSPAAGQPRCVLAGRRWSGAVRTAP